MGALWIVINIYSGAWSFEAVKGAYVRLVAARNGHELCRFQLTDASPPVTTRGLVLGKLYRNMVGRWCFESVGVGCAGDTANSRQTLAACGIAGGRHPNANCIESRALQMHTKCQVVRIHIKGVGLAAKDNWLMGGKSDPYFEIVDETAMAQAGSVSPKGFAIARSEIVKKSLDPVWMALDTEFIPGHSYRLVIYDWDMVGDNDLIGHLDLGSMENLVARLGQTGTRHKLIPPPPPHQQEAGEIEISARPLVAEVTATDKIMEARKRRMSLDFKSGSSALRELHLQVFD